MSLFSSRWIRLLTGFMLLLLVATRPGPLHAQGDAQVQELTGRNEPGSISFFLLPDLQAGDTLTVYAAGTSNNLDPLVALIPADQEVLAISAAYNAAVTAVLRDSADPLADLEEVRDEFFLAWDDDSGDGYDATFTYAVPTGGDYRLLVGGSQSSLNRGTFGDFRLLLGLNAPQVRTGTATPTGDIIAVPDEVSLDTSVLVQQIEGEFSAEKLSTFFTLNKLSAGDTLQVRVEATSGSWRPVLAFSDFGGKLIRRVEASPGESVVTLEYTYPQDGSDYRLDLDSCCPGTGYEPGAYRLLVGKNSPAVLAGTAVPTGGEVVQEPIAVQVGIRLQQITGVDQKAENYGAVATIRMEWIDRNLAFDPATCNCRNKIFTTAKFADFVDATNNTWPEFTIVNQQGNRWTQNRVATIRSDGSAFYLERFSTTLQAPDFDFRQFPFDQQDFFIRADLLFPEERFYFTESPDYSAVGEQLGEEEWYVTDFSTAISRETITTDWSVTRYSFDFSARRHLSFYILRIFVPILVVISVSWLTFFLEDYGKRIDVASGNLLLFIAFNFTISDDLPRLGYLTYMDMILVSTFVIGALVIVYNVILKRVEASPRKERIQSWDRRLVWLYPVLYVAGFALVTWLFLFSGIPIN